MKFMDKIVAMFGDKTQPGRRAETVVEYQGFEIQPTPKKVNGGWSTEAIIDKTIDGEIKTHHFIRADTNASKEGAVKLILYKVKIMIDQAGEKIFSK